MHLYKQNNTVTLTAMVVIGFALMLHELRKVLTKVKHERARKNIAQIICNCWLFVTYVSSLL